MPRNTFIYEMSHFWWNLISFQLIKFVKIKWPQIFTLLPLKTILVYDMYRLLTKMGGFTLVKSIWTGPKYTVSVLLQKGPRSTMGPKAKRPPLFAQSLFSYLFAECNRYWAQGFEDRSGTFSLSLSIFFRPIPLIYPCHYSSLMMLVEQIGDPIKQNLQKICIIADLVT